MIDFRNTDGTKFIDPRAAAFMAIYERLKTDKVLSRVVAKWSGMPYQVPQITANDLPYMQVSLAAGPIRTASANAHDTALNVEISYAVNAAGMEQESAWIDILNLYAHIEMAIDPFGDIAWLRNAVTQADAKAVVKSQPVFTAQGFSSVPLPEINAIAGKCVLSVNLKIDTCRS